jgi:predicted MPP superfamily phosphohydrolase
VIGYFLNSFIRALPGLVVLTIVLLIQGLGAIWILHRPRVRESPRTRKAILVGTMASFALLVSGFLLGFARVAGLFPESWSIWGRGLAIGWALLSIGWLMGMTVSSWLPRVQPQHSPARRSFLYGLRIALLGVPAAALGYGTFVQRARISLREERIVIPDLPADLDGLRLVQLTDIHLSPFLSVRELKRAVEMANETRANIAFVTGDLISTAGDPLDACLEALARLRGDAGVFGCLGNHEVYTRSEDYAAAKGARLGIRFLRTEAARLRFGTATLNLAGVDYQRYRKPYLVGAEKLVDPEAFNMLLSHNPDVFPVAVKQGFQFTLSGHTHGGQVRVEILGQDLNLARFFTHYVDGVYRQGTSSIFVSRGIGTIGLPTRLGAPPEVALIQLCRT